MPITQFASQRIVQGAAAILTASFPDQDGEARTPGTVTVGITRSDGSVLVAAGTATTATADALGVQTALTSAQTAFLDVLTCTWTEAGGAVITTVVEVCGGRYFSIYEARSIDQVLQDTVKFPDDDIKRVRTEVELELERITGRAFVPRFRLDQIDAGQARAKSLRLAEIDIRTIRWVKVGGVAYATSYWQLTSAGTIAFGTDLGLSSNQIANGPYRGDLPVLVTTGYEYGWPSPPQDLKRAMLTRLRSRLIAGSTSIPDRATAVSLDGQTYSLSTPGLRGARTGIPDVDEVYDAYRRKDWTEDFVGSLRTG